MQLKSTTRHPALNRLLAALLAGAVLVLALLTASGSLHHALHQGGPADGNACAVCLFVKGQVDLSSALLVFAIGIFLLVGGLMIARLIVPLDFEFLLPPGRAPPRLSSAS